MTVLELVYAGGWAGGNDEQSGENFKVKSSFSTRHVVHSAYSHTSAEDRLQLLRRDGQVSWLLGLVSVLVALSSCGEPSSGSSDRNDSAKGAAHASTGPTSGTGPTPFVRRKEVRRRRRQQQMQ